MGVDVEFTHWADVDSWWDTSVDTTPSVLGSELAVLTDPALFAEGWSSVDSWWERYIESNRGALAELQGELCGEHVGGVREHLRLGPARGGLGLEGGVQWPVADEPGGEQVTAARAPSAHGAAGVLTSALRRLGEFGAALGGTRSPPRRRSPPRAGSRLNRERSGPQ